MATTFKVKPPLLEALLGRAEFPQPVMMDEGGEVTGGFDQTALKSYEDELLDDPDIPGQKVTRAALAARRKARETAMPLTDSAPRQSGVFSRIGSGLVDAVGESLDRSGVADVARPALQQIEPLADYARAAGQAADTYRKTNLTPTGTGTAPTTNLAAEAAPFLVPTTPAELALLAAGGIGAGIKAGAAGGIKAGAAAAARNVAGNLIPMADDAFIRGIGTGIVPPNAVTKAIAEPVRVGDSMLLKSPTEGLGSLVRGAGDDVADAAKQGADEAIAATDGLAGNIRLNKFPEDTRDIIQQYADQNADLVQQARRGVRSDEQVLADAEALVNEAGGNWQKLQNKWKPGTTYNAEEITAIRGALTDSTRKVMDAATTARTVDSTENQLKLAEAILEQQHIQQIVHGVTAEAGRSLRAFRQNAAEALADGDVRRMNEILQQALGKDASPEKIAQFADMLKAIDINNPAAVSQLIRNVNKPGFWDYTMEYWYNSILSGPWTHARNLIGNTARTAYEPVRRGAAALVDAPLSGLQGRAQERFWEEVPASIAGALHGLPEGLRGALQTMRYGFNPADASRIELVRRNAIPGVAGRIIRIPSTALEAGDSFFHAINYRMSLWADATRMARKEGLTGTALQDRVADLISDPPAALIKASKANAEELLFRAPSDVASTISGIKNKYPALNFILPFTRTPQNLLKFGFKNSPLGLLDPGMYRRIVTKNPQAADEIAQVLLGSSIAASIGGLVATGQIDITAGVPTDASERDRFFREGKLPFAVKLPGVGWVQYNQIPGLAETLGTVAAVVQGVREGEDVEGMAALAGATIAQSTLDKSYMSGLSDFLDAANDPIKAGERYGTRQATGFVPFSSALRQTATAIDPTVRDPENLKEQFLANIPGTTGMVPPKLTAFGEEARRGLPSPIQISPDRQSDVDAELERLGVEIGFTGESIGGRGLNREQAALYQERAGKATAQNIAAAINSASWEKLSPVEKVKVIEKARDRGRDSVRDAVNDLLDSDAWSTYGPEEQDRVLTASLGGNEQLNAVLVSERFKRLSAEQQKAVIDSQLMAGSVPQ